MVTAKLESRTYVPSLTIALEFANIKFMGNREVKETLNKLMHQIEFRQYNINESLISWYDGLRELNNKQIQKLNSQIKKLKDEHKIPIVFSKNAYKQIKELKNQIESLNSENYVFSCRMNELYNKRFLSAYALKCKFEDALSDLEFQYKNETADRERLTNISFYEFIGDEKQLIENAQKMIKDIEDNLDINVKYEKIEEKKYCEQKGINIKEKENEITKQEQLICY